MTGPFRSPAAATGACCGRNGCPGSRRPVGVGNALVMWSGQNGGVISLELAHRIKAAGVSWQPSPGDHFHVPDRDLDETVFVVSDMVVEVLELPLRQRHFGFNGTTEWALDSI